MLLRPLFYQVVEKELLIQEKEKLYMELKQILARQPGPEVAEQVQLYQQTLKDKTKQLKSMASELNMYEAQVKEYQYELERLSKELQEAKKKYYMQKRKEQQARYVVVKEPFQIEKKMRAFHWLNLPPMTGSPYCYLSLSCLLYILPPTLFVANTMFTHLIIFCKIKTVAREARKTILSLTTRMSCLIVCSLLQLDKYCLN